MLLLLDNKGRKCLATFDFLGVKTSSIHEKKIIFRLKHLVPCCDLW